MANRPCMLCNEPLDGDICHTPGCAYNPEAENEIHEADWEYDENLHQTPEVDEDEEIPVGHGEPDPEFQNLPDSDLLEGNFEDDAPFDADAEQKDVSDDADSMDISQENLPEPPPDYAEGEGEEPPEDDYRAPEDQDEPEPDDEYVDAGQPFDDEPETDTDESTDEPESLSDESESEEDSAESEQAPDEEGTGDLDEMTDEQKDKLNEERMEQQLTEEDKGEDPSDDAHDLPEQEADEDDPDLPPKPRGCSGDCQPGDLDEEGDPCPHCTAKAFKAEMEGKHQSPEQMEQDWQKFLDDWQDQADEEGNGQGDQGDEKMDAPEQDEGEKREQRMENREAPDLDADDDDLPQKPPGCSGDCKPSDQYDDDADPCPHCTAKQFRDDIRKQHEGEDGEDLPDPEELGDMFQDFLKNWSDQQEKVKEKKDEKPEQNPDEIDEAPPQDEMEDGKQEEEPKEIEIEEDSGEFERTAKKMTVTQEKRFDNIVDRIEKKVEQTFGQTAEDIFTMKKQEGQFAGEEISQSIQITSRGVTYWVTISAAKEI